MYNCSVDAKRSCNGVKQPYIDNVERPYRDGRATSRATWYAGVY